MTDPVQPTVDALRWREHDARHDRDQSILERATTRLERQVIDTAAQLAAQVEASRLGLTTIAELHAKSHDREHLNHERIHDSEKQVRSEKEDSVDKRLEAMNEVRRQLDRQAATFATVVTVGEMTERIEEKIDGYAIAAGLRVEALEKQFSEYRASHAKEKSEQIAQLTAQTSALAASVDTRFATIAGLEAGGRLTTGKLYAALGGIAAFLGLVVIVVNLLTR